MDSKKPGTYDANKVEYTDPVKAAGGSKFPKVQEEAKLAAADCNAYAKDAENKIRVEMGESAQDAQANITNIPNPNKK